MTQFKDLGLAQPILQAVSAEGYTTPTPIQAKAIGPVMEGRDLIGLAQTGTGKTAAFALPILHRLAADRRPPKRRSCRVLVLSPTRELASQIAESFKTYGARIGVTVATIYGGVKYGGQIRAMAPGVDVLVACPGRLLDHMQEKTVDLSAVETFVLDEADQMLDLGFLPPIKKIVRELPKARQNLMFSATMPKEIRALASDLVNDPVEVSVAPPAATADRVEQQVLFVETARKRALLAELYADNALSRTLVFSRTKHGADRLTKHLETCGVEAAAIHGDKSQGQRERALAAFKAGKLRALVATDIAARGIDVDGVTHVINFDLPNVPESYVHRIGRTARAGAAGKAISLVGDDERNLLRDIQKLTRQTIPSFDRRNDRYLGQVQAADAAAGRNSGSWSPTGDRQAQPQPKPQGAKPHGGRPQGGYGHDRKPQAQASERNGHPKLDHSHAPSRGASDAPSRNRRRRRFGGQQRAGAAG